MKNDVSSSKMGLFGWKIQILIIFEVFGWYDIPTALFVKFGLNPGPKLYPTLALYWLNWWSQNDNKVRYYQSCFGFLKRYYYLGQYWNQPVVHTFVQPWPKVDSIFDITIGLDEFDVVEEFFEEDVQIGLIHFLNHSYLSANFQFLWMR